MSGSINCTACLLLVGLPDHAADGEEAGALACPRCGATLRRRKANSVTRAWALLIAAALLYIPANVFPVMKVTILGKTSSDTILAGVEALFHAGMWEVGLLVFVASITVPLLKLVGLTFLLLSVRRRSTWSPEDRTKIYRLIEYIGRWSMIDMFMVSILVALVALGQAATIVPGVGATCFAAVVVLTIFAASSFDSRLTWDAAGENG